MLLNAEHAPNDVLTLIPQLMSLKDSRSALVMVGGAEATFDSVKPLFDMMGKNVTLIGDVGAGVSLPNTATCQALFNACAAHGGSAWDHSAMVRALEMLANHEIGQPST